MKKINITGFMAAIFLACSAHADVLLDGQADIIGKWKISAEAIKLDGEKKSLKSEWNFKADGMLETTSTDSVGRTSEFKATLKYYVEDGIIKKQSSPGREKYETCKVIDKQDNKMTLKCTGLYLFLTKL